MRSYLLLFTLTFACGQPDDRPPDPPPPPPVDEPSFTADAGGGPALRLTGRFEGGLIVEVWADELGPVFGVAGRLAFDPEHLSVVSSELAPALLGDEQTLLRTDGGEVVFGFARRGPALGDAMLDGSVRLATVHFTPKISGDSRLEIARAMVRRSDGAFVPAAFRGAAIHTVGGAP